MKRLKIWWIIISGMGSVGRITRQLNALNRCYILNALERDAVFAYLDQARTYEQIVQNRGFADDEYTRYFLHTLVTDKNPFLSKRHNLYQFRRREYLPSPEEILVRTDKRYRTLAPTAEALAQQVMSRLRGESRMGTALGRQLETQLEAALSGNSIYTTMRDAAFAFLSAQDRAMLRGSKILDIGCGSGRESAELWATLDGEAHIVGIDPTEGLIMHAGREFSDILNQIAPEYVPLCENNRPHFMQAGATRLPFESNSFDAAFYSQVLHWTPGPSQAIGEILRVVRPGGLIFGAQGEGGQGGYMELAIRACGAGFFTLAQHRQWYEERGVKIETCTPAGIFHTIRT